VALASLVVFASVSHLQPDDGTGWRKGDWSVDPTSPGSDRWGLETIASPLAWGCSTGNDDTPVAVVDVAFDDIPDLSTSIKPQYRGDLEISQDAIGHGTAVASILAARGNNDIGMTGTMWQADLRPYDVRPENALTPAELASTPLRIAFGVLRAWFDGARVINVSMGINWSARGFLPDTNPAGPFFPLDTADVHRFERAFRRYLTGLTPAPLIVLAAGNDGLPAFWGGFANVQPDFPNVLVVAEAWAGPTLAGTSNNGSLAGC
jgi:hypothetical protein